MRLLCSQVPILKTLSNAEARAFFSNFSKIDAATGAGASAAADSKDGKVESKESSGSGSSAQFIPAEHVRFSKARAFHLKDPQAVLKLDWSASAPAPAAAAPAATATATAPADAEAEAPVEESKDAAPAFKLIDGDTLLFQDARVQPPASALAALAAAAADTEAAAKGPGRRVEHALKIA